VEHSTTTTLIRPDSVVSTDTPVPPPLAARHQPVERRRSILRKILSEGSLVATVSFALYVVVGVLLDFHYKTFNGDAVSRLANGFYVLYSRDPHLASIGFVWNPGTSIADLIPLLFYHLWTPLATHAFAATLQSAFCMAGAVYQVRCTLAEWGVARTPRLVLVVLLAGNGMILYYGGAGMSEGLYLFTLVATCRYLLRWLRDADLRTLVYAATALGACYMARNEAVGPALAAGVVVFGASFARSRLPGDSRSRAARRMRIRTALADTVIFEIPVVTAFVAWAVTSYVITGAPFGQFTSVYGTASQLAAVGSSGPDLTMHARLLHDVRDVFYLAPTLPILLTLAIFVASRRRDLGFLAPLSILGGAVAFDGLAYVANSIAWWFRYFIAAVPLEILLAGSLLATAPAVIGKVRSVKRKRGRLVHRSLAALAALGVLALAAPSFATTISGMGNPKVGYEETANIGYIFNKHLSKADEEAPVTWTAIQRMSTYFAQMGLKNGSIVVDNFNGCVPNLILMSPNPKIFVIPNDRDYQRTLADPLTFHTHYILETDPVYTGKLSSIPREYPALWTTGAGFAKKVHSFPALGRCFKFKLFKVTSHPGVGG
jgi:hypothetical protein